MLRGNRLLGVLDDGETAALIAVGKAETYAPEAVIFNKGDPGDRFYAVLNGQVRIFTSSEAGKVILLNILNPGDVLGEIAMIDGRERTAAAAALGRVELFRVDRSDFIAFIEQRPKLAVRMMVVLCERLRWVSENIEDVVFLDVPRRLAKRLLLLAETYGRPAPDGGVRIAQELSQESLGNMLGVSREIINKTLTMLKKRGFLTYVKGHIVLKDVNSVRKLSD